MVSLFFREGGHPFSTTARYESVDTGQTWRCVSRFFDDGVWRAVLLLDETDTDVYRFEAGQLHMKPEGYRRIA